MKKDEKNESFTKIDELLDNGGYTLADYIEYYGQRKSKLLMMNDDSYNLFCNLYSDLLSNKYGQDEKGARLEELTALLFSESVRNIFNVYRNCRTSTNEIDMVISWTENARLSGINNIYPCFGDYFLCECKNYKEPVKVTYIGKFCSLMSVSDINLGIMISWEGISGRGKWDASKGLIKKVALRENRYIIVIDKDDLKQIFEKRTNIFSLIYDKYLALKNDIDYSKYIKKHGAQDIIRL